MNKARPVGEAQLVCQTPRRLNCRCGEVETNHLRAALRQYQAVPSEMALQVKDPLTRDRRQLRLLNRVQFAVSGAEVRQVIAPRADMDADTLIPVSTIGAVPLRFGHDIPLTTLGARVPVASASRGRREAPSAARASRVLSAPR